MIKRNVIFIAAAVIAAAGGSVGPGAMAVWAAEQSEEAVPAVPQPGWNESSGRWYWQENDGSIHHGWLTDSGRTYYIDEDGFMVTGWKEIEGDWYYFHLDGAMNLGELMLDNGCYQFSVNGALASASWAPDTGGGAYEAGCYDDAAQELLDLLNEEKKDRYFDVHPDREDEYDGDMHRQYDRYAGFTMNMELNKAAGRRLDAASEHGYTAEAIPGEGTLKEYLKATGSLYRNRTLVELYVRGCQDQWEAFDKIIEMTDRKSGSKSSRAYTLEYYRQLGMAHRELDGTHYFMVILMR